MTTPEPADGAVDLDALVNAVDALLRDLPEQGPTAGRDYGRGLAHASRTVLNSTEWYALVRGVLAARAALDVARAREARVRALAEQWDSWDVKTKPGYVAANANPERLALRPDDQGALDDVVVRDVSMFRAEMMSTKELWMCCYFPGTNERVAFWVRAKGGRLEFDVTEYPRGDEFTFEPQDRKLR